MRLPDTAIEAAAKALYELDCKHDREMFMAGHYDHWVEPEPFESPYIVQEFTEKAGAVLTAFCEEMGFEEEHQREHKTELGTLPALTRLVSKWRPVDA